MKIIELRLRKLVATQEQRETQQPDATATAERRAGLVYNHLMGAHTMCQLQQGPHHMDDTCRAWCITVNWDYIHAMTCSMPATLRLCIDDEELMDVMQRRQRSFSQDAYYNSCIGHKHGQTSSRSAACVTVSVIMHIQPNNGAGDCTVDCLCAILCMAGCNNTCNASKQPNDYLPSAAPSPEPICSRCVVTEHCQMSGRCTYQPSQAVP